MQKSSREDASLGYLPLLLLLLLLLFLLLLLLLLLLFKRQKFSIFKKKRQMSGPPYFSMPIGDQRVNHGEMHFVKIAPDTNGPFSFKVIKDGEPLAKSER